MPHVNKYTFKNSIICPTLGWLTSHGNLKDSMTLHDQFIMEQGAIVGEKAREQYSEGVLTSRNFGQALKETKKMMNDPETPAILEATFSIDGYLTRADVLERLNDGWHMIEVKSGTSEEKYIDDMAYTTMVITSAGYNVSKVSLMHISKDFRLGMKEEELFEKKECTEKVMERVKEFQPQWGEIKEIIQKKTKPAPELKFECKDCEVLKECLNEDIKNLILELPRLSQSKYEKLENKGITHIEDIPDDFPLTENQAKVRQAIKSRKVIIDEKGLKRDLEEISWPAYYLDFETIQTAIPLYPNVAPWEQVPAQYSIHKCSTPDQIIYHREYLADTREDPTRTLADNLIKDLKGKGSIITYTNFEERIIKKLREAHPDLSKDLNPLIERLIDLHKIIHKNFYHPNFHGSTSIKQVLPTLIPALSYDDLDISEGGSAQAILTYIALDKYDEKEINTLRKKLLKYCKRDTLAMIKLHQKLAIYT